MKELIRKVLKEVRVPRSERVELYKDDNIIVVVPLTHRALKKYAHECQWCINSDLDEWEDYHKGKHAVIIQRNPKKPKIGITGNPTASEIFLLAKWDNNQSSFEDVCQMLDYEFRNDRTMSDYYVTISNDINNFATNIVYYSPETGIYDQEDNFLWNFNIEINDIPNVKPKVIEIMDDYLQEEEDISLQESIKRVLKEETNPKKEGLLNIIKEHGLYDFTKDTGLSYNDIYHRIGELPRDIKIQYLKDVVDDLEQTPNELDLTFITGSIPLYETDGWQMVYVEYLTNEDDVLRVHLATFGDEGDHDHFNTINEDDIDYETLDTLVNELSEKLQHKRN